MAACGRGNKNDAEEEEQKTTPTVVAYDDFDAETDAKVLRKAMKGFGTDEKAIINVVANRTGAQMVEVVKFYKTSFGRNLVKDLEGELKGKLEKSVLCRCFTLRQMDAWFLYKAMKGAGTNEKALIDILCTKTNAQMKEIKEAYKDMYGKELEKAVKGDVSGDFQNMLVSLITAERDDGGVDEDKAKKDAKDLKEAGVDAWGTDESAFNLVFCQRSYAQLRAVAKAYKKQVGEELAKSVKKEFSGDVEKGLLAILAFCQNPVKYYSDQLRASMKGVGTDDDTLIRVIMTRCEIDLEDIKKQYRKDYQKDLDKSVKSETSGDYEKMLLEVIKEQ